MLGWVCTTMALNAKTKERWWLEIEQDSTQSNKTMTDRYRCSPGSNWTRKVIETWPINIGAASTQTQTDRMMTDRYRCGPDSDWHDKWPINIGAVLTRKLKLIGRWPIDIGAAWFMPNWCISWFMSSWCSLMEEVINKIYNLLHHELE